MLQEVYWQFSVFSIRKTHKRITEILWWFSHRSWRLSSNSWNRPMYSFGMNLILDYGIVMEEIKMTSSRFPIMVIMEVPWNLNTDRVFLKKYLKKYTPLCHWPGVTPSPLEKLGKNSSPVREISLNFIPIGKLHWTLIPTRKRIPTGFLSCKQ